MRTALDRPKLHAFIREVGRAVDGPGRVYLVGGATALLLGIRDSTVDVDLKLDPEPAALFEGLARIKERLAVNVELASPDLFLPTLPGWHERSEFIERSGPVDFYHYDFYAQALAKILRSHRHDLEDARALVRLGKVGPTRLAELFQAIRENLVRYPAIDAGAFTDAVERFVSEVDFA